MAGGFLLIVMIDTLLLFSATGDPVYRLTLAWDNVAGEDITLVNTTDLMAPDQSGNISILPMLDPILLFFINHEFGILFFFALPAAIWGLFLRAKDKSGTALLKGLIIIGVAWAVVSTIALSKYSHPRYFIVTSICFIFPLAVWLQEVAFKKFKFIASGILLLLLAANFTGIYLDNKKPLSGEYLLRDYALTSSEPIYTDPYTADRASFLLEIENIDENVFYTPAPSGSLYFYNPSRLDKIDFADVEHFRPNENWQLIYRSETSRKFSGILLEALGLSDYIPESIFKRLDSPWQPIEVYRVEN